MFDRTLVVALSAFALVGCGQSTAPAPTAAGSKPTASAKSDLVASAESNAASQVATQFVRAVFAGDNGQAARLLTSAAQARYKSDPSILPAMGLSVERLEAGQVRLLNDREAGVQVLVTETGATEPTELGCLLKREAVGWRVCGLASESDGQAPVVIGFEPTSPAEASMPLVSDPAAPAHRTATPPSDTARR